MVGKTILHYKILEKLGEGGMGVVYKAEDTKLKRIVAIKFLPHQIAASEEERERFKIEAQAAAALNHPNIATIYAIEEVDGEIFIVMEFIDGQELRKKVISDQLSVNSVIDIAEQIAEGLKAAHAKGITHRDIKSSNIMVTESGQVKIMDFGLAKMGGDVHLTKTGMTLGTAAYMSPEQARGEEVDHRTDIWAFGVVLYEMLTGQLPFRGEYEAAMMYSILNEEPQPLAALRTGVPMELERIVSKALAKKANERYQHIDEVLAGLRLIQNDFSAGASKQRLTEVKFFKKKRFYLYGGVVTLLVSLIGIALFRGASKTHAMHDSIAVLPLANLSGDPEQEYFTDGMTEALITELAKISALKVISRTSVMQYKGAKKPLPEIARELQVDVILEGSVLRAGERVRVTAQLIEAGTDRHLWAKSYDHDLRDILTLQSEVAQAVANEIKIKLTPREQARLTKTRVVNPEAHEAYLKGRYFLYNFTTEQDYRKSLAYFQQAISFDSSYAPAYAGLAQYYIWGSGGGFISPQDAYPPAKLAVMHALQLDETLAEAYAALGSIKMFFDWNWHEAEQRLKRAIELNASSSDAHFSYMMLLEANRRFDEAIAEINHIQEIDPLNIRFRHLALAWLNLYAHHHDESISQCKKVLELDPNSVQPYVILGWNYAFKGMYAEATAASDKAISLSDTTNKLLLGEVAYVYGASGNQPQARKLLHKLIELSKQGYVDYCYIAMAYAGLGEKDIAFECLAKAYEARSPSMIFLKIDPFFENLRSDSRYTELLRKVGLEK